jgi:hypothetical protein
MSKLMEFVYPAAEDILNFDRFGPLKSCGGGLMLVIFIR